MNRMRTLRAALALVAGLSAVSCGKGTEAAPGPQDEGTAPADVPMADGGAVTSCGAKGTPDCPLQAWMKGNVVARLSSGDMPGLELAFRRIAAFEPAGYVGWTSISTTGEKAAHSGDIEGVRKACRACHEQHRDAYRANMRARSLPR